MSELTTAALRFPCPGCGSSIEYAAGTTRLRCPYCGGEQAVPGTADRIDEHSYDAWYAGPRKAVA